MGIENIEKILQEIKEVTSKKSGFGFEFAKKLIKEARDALEKDDVNKAESLLLQAKSAIQEEVDIFSEIEKIGEPEDLHYYSEMIRNEIILLVKSGKFDEARTKISELQRAVREEKEILESVSELEALITMKVPGSNPEEAEKLKIDAVNEIILGNYDKAKELIKKAKLAAKPTPDYLLGKAKKLAGIAEEHFSAKEYEKSVEKWEESIEEYKRAKETALERGDEILAEKIDEAIGILRENVEKAKLAIDSRDMLNYISKAKELVKKAHELFDEEKYDEAKSIYEDAMKNYSKAFELAKRRNFEEVGDIQRAMENVKTSIESCLIAKGDLLIKKAEKALESANSKDEVKRIEKEFRNILDYLNSINVEDKNSLEILKKRAIEGLIESMIIQAEIEKSRAEELFKQGEYYEAKELYRKIWDYLNRVLDESATLKTNYKKEYIDRLRDVCNQNIARAIDALTNPERVDKAEPVRVEDVVVEGRIVKVRDEKEGIIHPVEDLSTEYEKLKYIGGGNFADVYKAEKDGKVFAIKVPRGLNEKEETIFFNEVKKWEELKHRNIVNLIKPRLLPRPHLVLEYVDGTSLDKLIGKLSIEEACRIAFDIARALEYAHSKHILHCDLKPKNILVTKLGEAKVTDFGLATALGSSLKGLTLAYAAPETIENKKPDERTDIYQLGLIFYEMLTGVNPFIEGIENVQDVKEKILNYTPPPPSKYNSEAELLDDIVMRCLSKDPKDRPSLREFREAIYEYMKKYHGVSLHLTKDYETMARKVVRLAFYAAKQNDLKTALVEMEFAAGKVRAELREECNAIINRLRYMLREGMDATEELLKMMEALLVRL